MLIIAVATSALLVGLFLGALIGHILKPRRAASPQTRSLLDDMASAIATSGTHWDLDNPNILNDKTKASFRALLERYHREINS